MEENKKTKLYIKDTVTGKIKYPVTNVENVEGLDDRINESKSSILDGVSTNFDTLKEVEEWIVEHVQNNNDTFSAINTNINELKESKQDKGNYPVYTEFTYTSPSDNVTKTRKTIQLNNYDSISGVTTDEMGGTGVNIAMVNRWNVVDLGSTQLHINLNGKNERPTYNDNIEIALLKDVTEAVSNISNSQNNLRDNLEDKINTEVGKLETSIIDVNKKIDDSIDGLNISQYDTIKSVDDKISKVKLDILGDDLSETFNTLKAVQEWTDEHGTEYAELVSTVTTNNTDLNNRIDILETKHNEEILNIDSKIDSIKLNISNIENDYQKAGNYLEYADEDGRKVITFNNNDIIGAIANTEPLDDNHINIDGWVSLIHLNRWNVVDLGSPKTIVNINTPKGKRPTVQEEGQNGPQAYQIAYTSDISDINSELGQQFLKLDNKIEQLKHMLGFNEDVEDLSIINNILNRLTQLESQLKDITFEEYNEIEK